MTSPREKQQLKAQIREAKRELRRQNNAKTGKWLLYLLGGYVGLIIILAISGYEPKVNIISDEECAQSLSCLADKHSIDAIIACQPLIEQQANFDYKWTDGAATGMKLDRYRWANKDKGIIAYADDNIKFQNGFGAWSQMKYLCDYNIKSSTALQVIAMPGRW